MELNTYNFKSQHVFLSDSHPNYVHVSGDDKLLIVYEKLRLIKIYDLSDCEHKKAITSVPIVETSVTQLILCHFANYLALLGRNETGVKTLNVYCNYWIERQPIRRQFGSFANCDRRVDRNIRDALSLEVIEFNDALISSDGQHIACCESSANLCICCGYRLLIFNYQTYECANNIFRADFIHIMNVELKWFATRVALLENYLTIGSKTHISLVRINFDYDNQSSSCDEQNQQNDCNEKHRLGVEKRCVEYNFRDKECCVRLPSMFGIRKHLFGDENTATHADVVIGPVSQRLSCKFTLTVNQTHMSSPICRASLEILLCQYFTAADSVVDMKLCGYYKAKRRQTDPLNASMLRLSPISSNQSIYSFSLQSSADLIDGCLLIQTKDHSYCYSIMNRVELRQKINFSETIGDKVRSISINVFDDTLYALTNNGLYTFTLNFIPLSLKYKKETIHTLNLSFRLFLNIDFLLSTKNYLLLVTLLDDNKRTIYSLRKPSLHQIYSDTTEYLGIYNNNSKLIMNVNSNLNLISHLNAVLHQHYYVNSNEDTNALSLYQKCCAIFCNALWQSKHDSNFDIYDCDFELRLINEAKLNFSDLIFLNINHEIIFEFMRKNIGSNKTLYIASDLLSSFQAFLTALHHHDCTLFCQFALNQSFESSIRQMFANLLQDSNSIICRIAMSKILFDNNDTEKAHNILISLEDCAEPVFCQNQSFILLNATFTSFIENSISKCFYQFLMLLVEQNSSVKIVFDKLLLQNLSIRRHFLSYAFEQNFNLFDSDLCFQLISVNISYLCAEIVVPTNKTFKKTALWLQSLPPYHRDNQCLCIQCHPIISELFYLLYNSKNDDIVKDKTHNLLSKIEDRYEWLFTAKLLSMQCSDALKLLLNEVPIVVLPFCNDICASNSTAMTQIFHLLETEIEDIQHLDINTTIGMLISVTLNQLALLLTPTELIAMLPKNWRDFALPFVNKCIINFQSKILKESIITLGVEVKSMLSE